MKRIALLSDTHGYLDPKIWKYFNECDEIWHAGDIGDISVMDKLAKIKPVRGVYGNIDNHTIRSEYPLHNRFKCEETDVWITHIGGYPNRYDRRVFDKIHQTPPDLFICGHSHILKVIYDKKLNLLHLNPGAAGNHGFHKVKTMLRFSIDGKNIKNMEIIELGKR